MFLPYRPTNSDTSKAEFEAIFRKLGFEDINCQWVFKNLSF